MISKSFTRYKSLKADVPTSLVSRITSTHIMQKSGSYFIIICIKIQEDVLSFYDERNSYRSSLNQQKCCLLFLPDQEIPPQYLFIWSCIERDGTKRRIIFFVMKKRRRGVRRTPSPYALSVDLVKTNIMVGVTIPSCDHLGCEAI